MLAASILVGLLVMAVAIPARLDLGNRMKRWVHGDSELILKVAAELEEAEHHVRDMTLAKVPIRWFTWKYRLRFLGMLVVALVGWFCGIDNWWVAVTVGVLLGLQGALEAFLMPLLGQNQMVDDRDCLEWAWFALGVFGRIAMAAAGCLLMLSGMDWIDDGKAQGIFPMLGGLVVIMIGHMPGAWCERFSRKRRDGGFAEKTSADSILFLRSFSDDALHVSCPFNIMGLGAPLLPGGFVRFEEILVDILRTQGPVVAIGRPGEAVPELGAVRTYWPDDQWQDAVRLTANRCLAVVLLAGASDGLAWELENLRQWGLLGKTLVLLPPDPDADRSRERLGKVLDFLAPGAPPCDLEMAPVLWTGIRIMPNGVAVHYLSEGRHWEGYFRTTVALLGELTGTWNPPRHGMLRDEWRDLNEVSAVAVDLEDGLQLLKERRDNRPKPPVPKQKRYPALEFEKLRFPTDVKVGLKINSGVKSYDNKRFPDAAKKLEKALELLDPEVTPCMWAIVWTLLSDSEWRTNQKAGKMILDEVVQVFESLEDAPKRINFMGNSLTPPQVQLTLMELSWEIVNTEGRWKEGAEIFRLGTRAGESQGDWEEIAKMHLKVGTCRSSMGDHPAAKKSFQAALRIATDLGNVPLQLEAYEGLAGASRALGDKLDALDFLDVWERLRRQAGFTEETKWSRSSREIMMKELLDHPEEENRSGGSDEFRVPLVIKFSEALGLLASLEVGIEGFLWGEEGRFCEPRFDHAANPFRKVEDKSPGDEVDRFHPNCDESGILRFREGENLVLDFPARRVCHQGFVRFDDEPEGEVHVADLRSSCGPAWVWMTDERLVWMAEAADDLRVQGHVRYPWITGVWYRARTRFLLDSALRVEFLEALPDGNGDFCHTVELRFPRGFDATSLSRSLIAECARHHLRRGVSEEVQERLERIQNLPHYFHPEDPEFRGVRLPVFVRFPGGARYLDGCGEPDAWTIGDDWGW